MIKLFFLLIFMLVGGYSIKADQSQGSDQAFATQLDNVKNPFEDGLPKPVIVIPVQQPISQPQRPSPNPILMPILAPKPQPVPVPLETPPTLNLQGVLVGEDMHEAIINGNIVPLHGIVEGARLDAVSKQGVELFYKGKKIFLKLD